MDIIDMSELEELAKKWSLTPKEMDKVEKTFMRKMGDKLKRNVKSRIRASGIKSRTGAYQRSIKRGKVYSKDD